MSNKKTPDIVARGRTSTTLKCHTCGKIIDIGAEVDIYISYNFYYDHCLFFHTTCEKPLEMWDRHVYTSR